MATNDTELKLKLAAEGGAAAAKEVQKVEAAVSDLAAETKKLPAEMVPAWDQTAKAIEETAVAEKAVSSASQEVDAAFEGVRGRAAALRARLEEMRGSINATAGTGTGASGGGLKGLGSSLLSLAGGPIGVTVAALSALVAWLSSLESRANAAKASVADLADGNRDLSDRIAELDPEPVDQLAVAVERHAEAMDLVEEKLGVYLAGIDRRKNEAKLARDAELEWRDAVLARQVAEGTITAEDAVRQKGARAVEALEAAAAADLAAAREKLAAADEAVQTALDDLTVAREQLRKIPRPTTEARDAAEANRTEAVSKQREAETLRNDLEDRGSKLYQFGGMSAREKYLASTRLEALEAEIKVMQERGIELADLADEEAAEYEKAVNAKKQQAEKALEVVDALRRQQAAAAAEVRAADQQSRLAGTFGRATIEEQTAAQLAQIEARKAEEKRREDERLKKEVERAERQRIAEEQRRQRDAIDEEAKAAVGPLDARARRMEALGIDDELVSKAESIAQGLSDGVSAGEAERGLAAIDSIIARLPSALQATARAAMAPYEQKLQQLDAAVKQLESQSRNASNRQ